MLTITLPAITPPLPMQHVRLDDVTITYAQKTKPAVNCLSMTLQTGEIACLLGPSGCGKTSLLRAIAGFVPVQTGHISMQGVSLNGLDVYLPPQQRHIGFMFQELALFNHLTVFDNIAFGLKTTQFKQLHPRFDVAARVNHLLKLTKILDLARRYPSELSGGQQQRVALARALAPMPRLLLLDEPFSSLDAHLRRLLAAEVRDILNAEGVTALMVTHDQHEAFAFADQIGVMREGCLEQWSTPYVLYHEPATRFVAEFIGEGSFLPGHATPDSAKQHSHVEIELGHITPSDQQDDHTHLAGEAVDVLLRPDDIVHDDDSPLKALVVRKAFRGADFLYTLKLPSGREVFALVPSHHNHPIGEYIGIRLEADHVVTYPTQLP